MRRYHHSPSIPFHIARVECLQEAVPRSVSGLNTSGATVAPSTHSDASQAAKKATRVFVGSMWIAGVAIGVGLSVELNGFGPYGLFVQLAGFLLAAVSIVRHPEEYWP